MLPNLNASKVQPHDPDGQMPMPFQAADDYAQLVMAWATEPMPADVQMQQDIVYGDQRLHRYNVFSPVGINAAPVLVCWHGGGWTNGYRDYVTFMAQHVVAMGCVLVAPSYRLAPSAPLPAAFEDALLALAHVHQNASRYGGDGNNIYLTGHSAGAHLSALVALRSQDRVRAGVAESAVRGCLPVSGIMDLYHPSPAPGSLEERVYSMVLADPLIDAVMSPICWTTGNRVPFAISFGEHDSQRVQMSNRRLLELLKLQPGNAQLSVMAGQDHFQTHTSLREASHPWYQSLASMTGRATP